MVMSVGLFPLSRQSTIDNIDRRLNIGVIKAQTMAPALLILVGSTYLAELIADFH